MDESNLDPRAALIVRPWKGGRFTARFGITHRYPTSPEYFWWYLNKASEFFNTDFNPEQARQYELSYEQRLAERFEWFVRGYYYDIEDYISSTFVPKIGSVYYNIGEVTIQGAELGASANLTKSLRLWANFTWQEGDKDEDPWDQDNELTHQLPDLPAIMFNAGIDFSYADIFSSRLSVNYVDAREHFQGEALTELDSYTLVNLSARYRVLKTAHGDWELMVSGQNLLDEEYQEEDGYPMVGATVIGGVRLVF